jgi:plastocyanin
MRLDKSSNGKPAQVIPALLLTIIAGACGSEPARESAPASEPVMSGEHKLVIRMTDNMRFAPDTPTISVGDTVVWVNNGRMEHTTTDVPGKAGVNEHNILPSNADPWDSGELAPGATFRQVFKTPGEYTYLCTLHEAAGMVARLNVR